MNTLLFVKGLVGLLVFLAAAGALLAQLQVRKVIPPLIRARPATLLTWHRGLGRIALAGFVFNSVVCLLIGFYPAPRLDARHLIHGLLGALAALSFLGKVWVTRRKIKWGLQRIMPWGVSLFALQTGIFASATLFALWARLTSLV